MVLLPKAKQTSALYCFSSWGWGGGFVVNASHQQIKCNRAGDEIAFVIQPDRGFSLI
jgi:hypothetical protein